MRYRNDDQCEHDFKPRVYSDVPMCQKCYLSKEDAARGDEGINTLNAAEEEFGPFGAGRGMLTLIGKADRGLNHFMLLDKAGRWLAYTISAACYYQLQELNGSKGAKKAAKNAAFIWDWPFMGPDKKTPKFQAKAWKACGKAEGWASQWFTWLANSSPWAYCFVTKSWVEAFEGGVIYRADVDASHLMSVMSGVRYIGEFPHIPQAFVAAADYTNNGMLALLAAHYMQVGDDGLAQTKQHSSGHAMWSTGYFEPKKQMANYLNGKLVDTGRIMNKDWTWVQCYNQFGEAAARGGYSWDEPAGQLRGPDTKGKYEEDMFGAKYHVPGGMTVEAWMDEFTEEVYKWELKCPSSSS